MGSNGSAVNLYTDESVSAKIFIEFVALIIRSRFYTLLKDENIPPFTMTDEITNLVIEIAELIGAMTVYTEG